jgi:hypothetical protein
MATTTNGFPQPATAWADPVSPVRLRRRLSPRAARASAWLGHAIEYLANEIIHDQLRPAAQNGRLEAVQLLMAVNRSVYLECPEEPTLAERCRRFLRP